jgi:dTMP kinase
VAEVRALSAWATGGLWPDLTVLLDVPTALAAARLGVERDRFESEGDHFHERVAEGFRSLAATAPEPWVVIDGARPVDEVAASVRVVVRERLQLTM